MNGAIEKKQNHIVASCRIITKAEEVQTEEYDLSKVWLMLINLLFAVSINFLINIHHYV